MTKKTQINKQERSKIKTKTKQKITKMKTNKKLVIKATCSKLAKSQKADSTWK